MPFSYNTKIGDRFGSRTITGFSPNRDSDGHLRCHWKCECGNTGTGGIKAFRHALNCQKCRPDNFDHLPKHGHSIRGQRTALYDAWANMMQRTRGTGSPSNRQWYFNKGIKVCDEWQTFEAFRDWATANGWRRGLSLDRIHSGRNYEPGNCEWITRSENSRRAAQDMWRRHTHSPIGAMLGFGV
jgi:hypothetical protein